MMFTLSLRPAYTHTLHPCPRKRIAAGYRCAQRVTKRSAHSSGNVCVANSGGISAQPFFRPSTKRSARLVMMQGRRDPRHNEVPGTFREVPGSILRDSLSQNVSCWLNKTSFCSAVKRQDMVRGSLLTKMSLHNQRALAMVCRSSHACSLAFCRKEC